ncbi:hypothetical protein SH203_01844 [Brevundimonas sp. SH203]|uniref:hypothetical protein n=1 Tax=Brevundimonas sp. SH203 TaxID=345167 RepID=UPI0009D4EB0F|nr:hypothetical protein [Brevundimonas sp. SH203]GAW41438.1 hypothetical protein SH203_01844 [Brevundimonas sp. SH203]
MRGAFSDRRRTTALIAAAGVLALCAGGVWLATRPTGAPAPEPADARVMRQIQVQAGHAAELRYSEPGQRRAVCGYIGRRAGVPATAFVSIPNRILFSDDPLPTEFREMRQRYCPGFLIAPSGAR